MSSIELKGITKKYGDTQVVQPTNLQFELGELVTLLGPSGSGKSTILAILARLTSPTSGHMLICGNDVTNVPPARRNLGLVFQSYALFPHMTVFENIRFPLAIRKVPNKEIESRVKRALDRVRLA